MTASTNPVRNCDFTISLPIGTEEYYKRRFLNTKLVGWLSRNSVQYVFQWEKTGDVNFHFQGRFRLDKKKRTLQLVKEIERDVGMKKNFINVSPTNKTCRDFDYVLKEESRIKDYIYADRDIRMYQKIQPEIALENFLPWEKFIFEEWLDLNKRNVYNVSKRRILFVVDRKGGSGKSTFVKDLWIRRSRDVCCLSFDGSISQSQSAIIDAGAFPFYVIDLPRSRPRSKKDRQEFEDRFHNVLEKLCNGMLQGTMYGKLRTLVMPNPQIVVFMNWEMEKLMSRDRYVYIDLERKETFAELAERISASNASVEL